MRSGFVAVAGRPNVGKSTLVNHLVGAKVTITSPRPNTTRRAIRGVVHLPDAQVVLVDTPGLHRPRTALGRRLLTHIDEALSEIDAVIAMLDATEPVGPGDRLVLERCAAAAPALFVVVNKIDRARPEQVLERLAQASEVAGEQAEYFPISAKTGKGVGALLDAIVERLPEGPPYFPPDMCSDLPDEFWVAELVREQLLRHVREELPHSIACRVVEWDWPRIVVEIVVERDSQRGIVIGKGGSVLKAVGTRVREQLPPGACVELRVVVEKNWQRRPALVERLGY
jgi:GTP-binding protein Era